MLAIYVLYQPCIESVLNQSYPAIEHVFVDGGSTDGTIEMLSRYKAEHSSRITLLLEPDSAPGSGMGEAWNKGLKAAKGDIIGWLGGDDMLSGPDAINSVVEFFRSNPAAYFVHGGCNYIDATGKVIRTCVAKEVHLDELTNKWNSVSWPSAYYKKEVVEKVGWADEWGNDLDYLIRIAKIFPIHSTEKMLSNFRVHGESQTGNLKSYLKNCRKDVLVSRLHGGRYFSRYRIRYYSLWLKIVLPPSVFHLLEKIAGK